MRAASEAAAALGQSTPLQPLDSPVIEADRIVAALKVAETELRERSAHQRLILGELSHRVKNVLAVVQALVLRSLSEQRPVTEAREVISKRLHALARAHELLTATNWRGASLRDLVAAELAPYAARAQIEGPQIIVQAGMVQTLAILVHELATNAVKHGSLSRENGTVLVGWAVTGSGMEARCTFLWKEMGGPVVSAPSRKGFGSTLLEGLFLPTRTCGRAWRLTRTASSMSSMPRWVPSPISEFATPKTTLANAVLCVALVLVLVELMRCCV
jgi:two-component sensor histidine kinase